MATILETARAHREKLLNLDDKAAADIVRHYSNAQSRIQHDLDKVTKLIEDRKAAGKATTIGSLKRQERYKDLIAQVQEQTERFSRVATGVVKQGQKEAVDLAKAQAKQFVMAEVAKSKAVVGYTWNRVPKEALEHLVGFMTDGSPLRSIFDTLGAKSASSAMSTLSSSVIRGINPRETARLFKEDFGNNLARSLTVARTEQMRAYRTATVESYKSNSDVVEGWIRYESLDDLTCVICIVEHGKEYDTNTDFETHPNCRGTLIPKVVGVDRNLTTGVEWFGKQQAEKQEEILGAEKYQAYKDGDITLQSLVARTEHPDWGGGRRERSLEDAKVFTKAEQIEIPPHDPIATPIGFELSEVRRLAKQGIKYTEPEVEAMSRYKLPKGYKDINGALMDGRRNKSIKPLMEAIERSPIPGDMTVYRGVEGSAVSINDLTVGSVMSRNSFTSTTLDKEWTKYFDKDGTGVTFEIQLPKGYKGLFIDGAITQHGWIAFQERELLLAPNAGFKVVSVDKEARKAVLVPHDKQRE